MLHPHSLLWETTRLGWLARIGDRYRQWSVLRAGCSLRRPVIAGPPERDCRVASGGDMPRERSLSTPRMEAAAGIGQSAWNSLRDPTGRRRNAERSPKVAVSAGLATRSTALLETIGRKSGVPRLTPGDRRLDGDAF